jgi:hypothetical protein
LTCNFRKRNIFGVQHAITTGKGIHFFSVACWGEAGACISAGRGLLGGCGGPGKYRGPFWPQADTIRQPSTAVSSRHFLGIKSGFSIMRREYHVAQRISGSGRNHLAIH